MTLTPDLHVPPRDARIVPITVTDITRPIEYECIPKYLPGSVRPLAKHFAREVDEIKLMPGKPVQFRFGSVFYQYPVTVSRDDLNAVEDLVGGFKANNRKGIPETLHRVSKGNNDLGVLDKVIFRVGRLLRGVGEPFRDLIASGGGIGICGKPASGKTTLARDLILMDGEMFGGGVHVVDTSNELLGEGDEGHPAFDEIVQDKVGSPENLVPVIRNAIRNEGAVHVWADEVGYEPGDVQMVQQAPRAGATTNSSVHGGHLADVLENEVLYDLFGIRERGGVREVVRRPAFRYFIEVRSRGYYVLHRDLEHSVHALITGQGAPVVEHIVTQVRT